MSNSLWAALQPATPEQTQAYERALVQGPEALISLMQAFPNSSLVPQIIEVLARQIGVEAAVQAALDAGVPTETVFEVAAAIAPDLFTPTGQAAAASGNESLTGPY
jgi:hypothetical protein